jgi:hypothetical protein
MNILTYTVKIQIYWNKQKYNVLKFIETNKSIMCYIYMEYICSIKNIPFVFLFIQSKFGAVMAMIIC